MTDEESDAWKPDLARWRLDLCTIREGHRTPLWILHNSFAEWALRNDAPTCRRSIFAALLRAEGIRIVGRLVYGLALDHRYSPQEPMAMEELDLMNCDTITATQWLKDFLQAGPCGVADIRAAAWLAKFSWPTIMRAKAKLGVESRVAGIWNLPPDVGRHSRLRTTLRTAQSPSDGKGRQSEA